MKRSLFYTAGSIRTNNAVGSISLTKRQQMNLSYDLNGNIKKMGRYGDGATQMDSLIYWYTSNTNKLKHVDDTLTSSAAFTADIDDQSPGNYAYDASGNLTADVKEHIYAIEWDARGKVRKIKKDKVQVSGQFLSDLEFIYDSYGQRIVKIVKPHHKPGASIVLSPQWNWTYTFYQLDAQGNVLATYERKYLPQGGTSYKSEYKLVEQYVYAGSRLGSIEQNLGAYNSNFTASVTVTGTNDDDEYLVPTSSFGSNTYTVNPFSSGTYYDYAYKTGQRHYEQVNHLGNVMSTISDRKIPVDRYNFINTGGSYTHSLSAVIGTYVTGVGLLTHKISTGGDSKADGWMAEIETYSDYYPFGQLADNRFSNPGNHRYGYNGMEMDNDVKGVGNSYTSEWRQYDPRLGRWLSLDPYMEEFVDVTPYNNNFNNPIANADPNGDCPNGDCGDEQYVLAEQFVQKHFDKNKNNVPVENFSKKLEAFYKEHQAEIEGPHPRITLSVDKDGTMNYDDRDMLSYEDFGDLVDKIWEAHFVVDFLGEAKYDDYVNAINKAGSIEEKAGAVRNMITAGLNYRRTGLILAMELGMSAPMQSYVSSVNVSRGVLKKRTSSAGIDVPKGQVEFSPSATEAAHRLGFLPEDVSIVNGVADIPILYTTKISLSDVNTVFRSLRSAGASQVKVNTGPIINPKISAKIQSAYKKGETFIGFDIIPTGNPKNMYILRKKI